VESDYWHSVSAECGSHFNDDIFFVISHITEKRRNKRIRVNLKKKLQALSPRQKAIILQLLRSEDKTISLDKNSGDTIYLENNLFFTYA